jgi:hypothetical protein
MLGLALDPVFTTGRPYGYVLYTYDAPIGGSPPTTCIREASVILAHHAARTAADNGKTSIFEGATETGVFTDDMSQTALQYKRAGVTPAAGSWNQAAANGLVARVGYSTDSSPNPYWDSIMLEAAVP